MVGVYAFVRGLGPKGRRSVRSLGAYGRPTEHLAAERCSGEPKRPEGAEASSAPEDCATNLLLFSLRKYRKDCLFGVSIRRESSAAGQAAVHSHVGTGCRFLAMVCMSVLNDV